MESNSIINVIVLFFRITPATRISSQVILEIHIGFKFPIYILLLAANIFGFVYTKNNIKIRKKKPQKTYPFKKKSILHPIISPKNKIGSIFIKIISNL
ncbi:hypothetical protein GCM10027291_32100 [Telluribacter humicola]